MPNFVILMLEKTVIMMHTLNTDDYLRTNIRYALTVNHSVNLESTQSITSYVVVYNPLPKTHFIHRALHFSARIWQKYEESLPTPNMHAFTNKPNSTTTETKRKSKSYCCSTFIRCIINSILLYLSFFISMSGISTQCELSMNTSPDILTKCDVEIGRLKCEDAGFSPSCVIIHYILNEMKSLYFVSHPIILSAILCLVLSISYDRNIHCVGVYVLFMLSGIIVIFKPFIPLDDWKVPYLDEIDVFAQIGMFLVCLLFILCTKCGNSEKRKSKTKQFPSGKNVLDMLQEQENMESTPFNIQRSGQPTGFSSNHCHSDKKAMDQSNWMNGDASFNEYAKKPMNSFCGEYGNYSDSNSSNRNYHYEPMDVCSPHQKPRNDNFNAVENDIYGLNLNNAF